MIAASLKDAEGDKIIDILLRKGADVNIKSNSGQASRLNCLWISWEVANLFRMLFILQVQSPISPPFGL